MADTKVRCDDCGHTCLESECDRIYPNIPHLYERMAPGEEVPAAECPECGALAHEVRTKKKRKLPTLAAARGATPRVGPMGGETGGLTWRRSVD